jgi:CheY-like chemotaxis protein
MYLPRVEDALAFKPRSFGSAEPKGGSETILLVEDEALVRDLARTILEMYGYRVLEAQNAKDALIVSGRHNDPIDLMLTDVVMPGMNGRELARRLAPVRPGMRVLYMSGYTQRAISDEEDLGPGTAFLQKPFTAESLVRKVRELLDV